MSGRGIEQVAALRVEIETAIVGCGETRERAQVISAAVMVHVRQVFAGERVYIPARDYTARTADILADWRAGKTPQDIARDRGVPLPSVYRVIGQRNRSRSGGFGTEDWNL